MDRLDVLALSGMSKGISRESRDFLVAAGQAVMKDPGLIVEYGKIGAATDPKIDTPQSTQAELDHCLISSVNSM